MIMIPDDEIANILTLHHDHDLARGNVIDAFRAYSNITRCEMQRATEADLMACSKLRHACATALLRALRPHTNNLPPE